MVKRRARQITVLHQQTHAKKTFQAMLKPATAKQGNVQIICKTQHLGDAIYESPAIYIEIQTNLTKA